jgi:hypothetical protein
MTDDVSMPEHRGDARVVRLPGLREADQAIRDRSGGSGFDAERYRRRAPAKAIRSPQEAAAAGRHWCAGCGQTENPDGAYRICGECGHVFGSEADLITQDYEMQLAGSALVGDDLAAALLRPDAPLPAETGDEVWICPVCCHDF